MAETKKVSEGLHLREYIVDEKERYLRERQNVIHHELLEGPIARFAMQLMDHLAIVAGVVDGEDSGGRAKCRLSTPQEVVDRACEIAALAFDQFSDRGWLLATSPPENIAKDKADVKALESVDG